MTAVVRGRAALAACQCGGLNGHHQVCPRYLERESRLAHEVTAERDAALATIERVKAIVDHELTEPWDNSSETFAKRIHQALGDQT